jgi:UDP-N-acetylmuramate--alanine ligase
MNTPLLSYIDDYAHHPSELKASIESVRKLYPQRKIICVFQPHLFSRTRDFADEFAEALAMCDDVLLLPIYPAREEPIPGVTSEWLVEKIEKLGKPGEMVEKQLLTTTLNQLVQTHIANQQECVVLTLGAGDIDRLVEEIKLNLNAYE